MQNLSKYQELLEKDFQKSQKFLIGEMFKETIKKSKEPADDTFKKLGYEKVCRNHYKKETDNKDKEESKHINFIDFNNKNQIEIFIGYTTKNGHIRRKETAVNIEEQKAINKKLEELGWL